MINLEEYVGGKTVVSAGNLPGPISGTLESASSTSKEIGIMMEWHDNEPSLFTMNLSKFVPVENEGSITYAFILGMTLFDVTLHLPEE